MSSIAAARPLRERRDLPARHARDRLADFLGLHPRVLGALSGELARLLAGKYEAAVRDELTGALIRSAGVRALRAEVARAHRSGEPLAVVFVDLEGLKAVNDRRGHAAGDQVLRVFGSLLGKHLRPYDLVIRWGGDEFLLALSGCTQERAEQIWARIAAEFVAMTGLAVRLGSAELRSGDSADDLAGRADADLFGRRWA